MRTGGLGQGRQKGYLGYIMIAIAMLQSIVDENSINILARKMQTIVHSAYEHDDCHDYDGLCYIYCSLTSLYFSLPLSILLACVMAVPCYFPRSHCASITDKVTQPSSPFFWASSSNVPPSIPLADRGNCEGYAIRRVYDNSPLSFPFPSF